VTDVGVGSGALLGRLGVCRNTVKERTWLIDLERVRASQKHAAGPEAQAISSCGEMRGDEPGQPVVIACPVRAFESPTDTGSRGALTSRTADSRCLDPFELPRDLSCFIGPERPNVKDEPRPSLARLVQQSVNQSVLFLRENPR
jgi:hypothetical protein